MKNKPQDILKTLLDNPDSINMEQMDALVKNSINFFNEYIEMSKSGNKEAQEKALKEILDFKNILQEATQKISEETGLSPSELMEVMNNPANFEDNQWESMQAINDTITDFNTSLLSEMMPQMQKKGHKPKRARKKNHLAI